MLLNPIHRNLLTISISIRISITYYNAADFLIRSYPAGNRRGKENMNKYRNKKITVDGILFDSKNEAARYQELKILEKAGIIKSLRLQPEYELQPKFKIGKKTERSIKYIADFEYIEGLKTIVEDVKGFVTKDFSIKRKMFLFKYGETHEFRLIKG